MSTFLFEEVHSSILLEFLGVYPGIYWKKTWSVDGLLIGFFEFKPHLYNGDAVVNIIVEKDDVAGECKLRIHSHGSGKGMMDYSVLDRYVRTLKEAITNLATENQWRLRIEKEGKIGGYKCPHCGAYYVYAIDKILDDGLVSCQNCAKKFELGDSQDSDISEIGAALKEPPPGN